MDQYIDDNDSTINGVVQSSQLTSSYNGRASVLQQIRDNTFPYEVSELIYKSFERTADNSHYKASYYKGCLLPEVISAALEPTVSIVFLPGPDRMAVAALEQKCITKEEPNQKSPSWRVYTAGTLLSNHEVSDDLHVTQSDCTPQIAAMVRQRQAQENSTSGSSQTALVLRKPDDRVLTIDSDKVKIPLNLVTNFRQVLCTDARGYNDLLQVMIEDARRLAIRSPVLFRMSTRQRIIHSKSTRYGVDHGTMFETVATSATIKNIILKSDACYHSLSDPGSPSDNQVVVKPRFLQMLTLFISLLNDDDLRTISAFLEKTYRIKADRSSIELLVLKVLPLASINSSIFVMEMVNAVEQNTSSRLPEKDKEEAIWDGFIGRLLSRGYILPGFTEQMGQPGQSWLVHFPAEEGFKDSCVFNNLQFQGDTSSAINQIPSIDLGTDNESREVTAVLTDGRRYLVDNADIQKVIGMVFGNYSLTQADGDRRTFDMRITEEVINQELTYAIQQTNKILRVINSYLASSNLKGRIIKRIVNGLETLNLPRPKNSFITYEDVRSCGRLTWHQARIGNATLAVAYKVEGKKVHRRDLIRNLTADLRTVRSMVMCIEHELDHYNGKRISDDIRQTMLSLRHMIPEINQYLGFAEQRKLKLERIVTDTSDEPIKQTIYPGSISERNVAAYWAPYNAKLEQGALCVECCHDQVKKVVWANQEIAEIYLKSDGTKFFVSPLRKLLDEEQESEIKPGDKILLIGQYFAIVDVDQPQSEEDEDESQPLELPTPPPPRHTQQFGNNGPVLNVSIMPSGRPHNGRHQNKTSAMPVGSEIFANWMKIVGVEKRPMDRRRVNRVKGKKPVVSVFN